MITIEQKRKVIDEYLKKNVHKEDITLVQLLYGITFTKDCYKESSKKQRLKQTTYSNYTELDLLSQFQKKHFNDLDFEQMENLFQEVYNRQTKKANCEPTQIISIRKIDSLTTPDNCIAYFSGTTNELNLNKTLISKALDDKKNFCAFNSNNVSSQYLVTFLHEVTHGIQYQQMLGLFANDKLTLKQKQQASLNFIMFALRNISNNNKNDKFNEFNKQCYDLTFTEHQANMNAIKTMKDIIENCRTTKSSKEALLDFSLYTARVNESYSNNKSKFYNDRINKMQNFAQMSLDLFDECIKDSPLKDKLLKYANAYLDTTNGKSKYMKDLSKDFVECEKCIKLSKNVKENYLDNVMTI